jgi:hypothetical protein
MNEREIPADSYFAWRQPLEQFRLAILGSGAPGSDRRQTLADLLVYESTGKSTSTETCSPNQDLALTVVHFFSKTRWERTVMLVR